MNARTLVSGLLMLLVAADAIASPVGDCAGTPGAAVVSLPAPLSEWGEIICTEFGHIIGPKEGWIWSYPGAFAPVMIPAQMVRANPSPVGNAMYFTAISFVPASGPEADAAYEVFIAGFDPSEPKPEIFRLNVTSVSGKSLQLYFFRSPGSIWGIWCRETCDALSKFMLLDMKRPKGEQ